MAFKPIYFLVVLICVASVLKHVQAATQLRLVNGLLIIEDRHPLEVSSSSSSSRNHDITLSSGSRSSSQWETHDNDLHGHGYLNRNRPSLRSSRRLLKDGQRSATTTVTNSFISGSVQEDPPTPIAVKEKSIDESTSPVLETVTELNVQRPDVILEKKRTIESDNQKVTIETSTDKIKKDTELDPKLKPEVVSVTSPTMDVITIIWYFSTFIALVAFFVVMVCSDKYCTRVLAKPEETVISAPATPAPSYREFAPPSYESVMKKYKSRVFIIPMLNERGELKVPDEPAMVPSTPASTVIEVEVQKPPEEEVSHCKAAAETQVKSVLTPPKDEGQLMVVVVVNENQMSNKSASESDANESR